MKKKKLIAIISSAVAVVIVASVVLIVALAGKGGKKDAIWIMTEEMSGLFNPFYATAAADHDVIGMTQIGMLSTDSNGDTAAGDNESTVVKAFTYEKNSEGNTVYKFVIKNNLKFSDGEPLTMNDVMFNIYEYLDPVYTGSSTMYSTKILGLNAYRTQTEGADEDSDSGELSSASQMAYNRRLALELIYTTEAEKGDNSYDADENTMNEILDRVEIPSLYKAAFNDDPDIDYRAKLKDDYKTACETFRKEIENDYKSAKESFDLTSALYKPHAEKLKNDVFKFFLFEGYIKPVYAKKGGKDDKSNIDHFEDEDIATRYDTMEKAINFVYSSKIRYNFNQVITYWGTASTMLTRFEGDARSIILQDKKGTISNISGIVSLGHIDGGDTQVVVEKGEGKTAGGDLGTYKIAKSHDEKGRPSNSDEYDVLQITVKGEDPKAIYNFGFTVAPQHYYAADDNGNLLEKVDIKNNKFGLRFADSDFQTNVIQSQRHVSIPVGAGPYMATNYENEDVIANSEFNKDNTVYFKANENFMFEVKTKKLRLRVVSSSNAIDALANGEVDYITPQLTDENRTELKNHYNDGIRTAQGWQLGYGYVGINAGKVPNIYIRRAIMAAMNRNEVKGYYPDDAVQTIEWPMSKVSWAYPKDYTADELPQWTKWSGDTSARSTVQSLMAQAEASGATEEDRKITFTIAGSSISEHPTYQVFVKAAEILNSLGWEIEIKADSQALTKLATGSLAVWAAAWGSTIDPDMYQVYHKNSSATSVYAWGYREIFGDQTKYSEEVSIINRLSEQIEAGRETTDRATRIGIYKEAMKEVLNLAVEMPIYQRMNLYAFNTKVIMESSLKYSTTADGNVNPYSSPLERIWEVEMVK